MKRCRNQENNQLESMQNFLRRKFCSRACQHEALKIIRPYTDEEIKTAYEAGSSCPQLSKKYGISADVIRKDVSRLIPKLRKYSLKPAYGSNNTNWKGGITKTDSGYIRIKSPNHPNASPAGKYVREHILVACQKYGLTEIRKPLAVHHIDLNKANNDPSNLSLMHSQLEHNRIHWQLQMCAVELLKKELIQYQDDKGYFISEKAKAII